MEQIRELQDNFNEEKKRREINEEEILNSIANVAKEIENSIKKQRYERERNEENILDLIEKVIEHLKKETYA